MKRWYDHIWINIYWLGLNFRNTAIGSIFMPYLVDAFAPEAVKNTALGGMRTAGLIIAMLVQPAAGLLSDRSTSRFGRRRPYIFVGTMLDLVFLVAIGLVGNYWSLLLVILLIQFSANLSHGSLQGLIPDLVPEEHRGVSSAIKAIFELLPLILVGFTVAPMVAGGQLNWAIVTTCTILLVTMILTVVFVKEKPLKDKPDTPFWPPMLRVLGMLAGILAGAAAGLLGGLLVGGLVGLIAWPLVGQEVALTLGIGVSGGIAMIVSIVIGVWAGALATLGKDAQNNSSFTWWVVNRLFFLAAITSIQGFAPFFFMDVFNIDRDAAAAMTGNLIIMVGVFTLISALPGGWLADRFGQKRMVGLSGYLATFGGLLLLLLIWMPSTSFLYVIGGILGLATGLFMTTNWALGTQLVPPLEAGRYLGISNLAGAGAGMIGSGIGGPVADSLNARAPGLGYFAIFAAYAVLFLLSVVSLRWVRDVQIGQVPVAFDDTSV
jgi:MFS family permease